MVRRLATLMLAAAYGLAGVAYAQTTPPAGSPPPSGQTPSSQAPTSPGTPGDVSPGRSNPGAYGEPPQPDEQVQPGADTQSTPPSDTQQMSSDAAANPRPREDARLAETGRAGVSAGMPVEGQDGNPLGFVVDVVPGPAGTQQSGYVVIAGQNGGTTPVPYTVASSLVQNGKLVVDHARFDSAPKVQQSQIEDASGGTWKAKTDSYWSGGSATGGHGEDHTQRKGTAQKQGQSPSPQQDSTQSQPQDPQQAPSSPRDEPPHS